MYMQYSQPAPVIFGWGALSILGDKIKERGCKKALLVFDKGIREAGIADKAFSVLRTAGVEYVPFGDVVSDPPDEIVDQAWALASTEEVDCIVGLGGGSCLDTAKAAAILATNPGPAKKYILSHPIYVDTKIPVFLLPTTAGTGSEMTTVAVISRPEENAKWSVFVNVALAIVDPELTLTLPKYETANTGLDAFSHAAEAMTNLNWNHHADLMGEGAIKKISKHLLTAYHEPENVEARTEMALAANWAGLAFNDPVTHVGHSVADAFSCHLHTPHGLGCALALPEALNLVAPAVPEKMAVIAAAMGLELTGRESGAELGTLVADAIRKLMRSVNMKSLREMGYSREQILSFVPDVVANHLSSFCPVEVTPQVAEKLLAAVYDTYQ